jgi:hypothetical protein
MKRGRRCGDSFNGGSPKEAGEMKKIEKKMLKFQIMQLAANQAAVLGDVRETYRGIIEAVKRELR